jgi:hypothetical protein
MRNFTIAYILLTLLLILICTGCSIGSYVYQDPRCQPRQYCPYTDAPAPIRTEVLR